MAASSEVGRHKIIRDVSRLVQLNNSAETASNLARIRKVLKKTRKRSEEKGWSSCLVLRIIMR